MFSEEELKHFHDRDLETVVEDYKKLSNEEKKKVRKYLFDTNKFKMTSFCTK